MLLCFFLPLCCLVSLTLKEGLISWSGFYLIITGPLRIFSLLINSKSTNLWLWLHLQNLIMAASGLVFDWVTRRKAAFYSYGCSCPSTYQLSTEISLQPTPKGNILEREFWGIQPGSDDTPQSHHNATMTFTPHAHSHKTTYNPPPPLSLSLIFQFLSFQDQPAQ